MTRKEKYTIALKKLAELISDKPLTAIEIAKEIGLSKVAIYNQLHELRMMGFAMTIQQRRVGSRGPTAVAYGVSSLTDLGAFY